METMVLVNGAFWASQQQADTLTALEGVRGGCIARVEGYSPASGYIERPVCNYSILTRFSTERLYQRKLDGLRTLTLDSIMEGVKADPVLSALSADALADLFAERVQNERDSIYKTLDGDRSDAHRAAHDRCYAPIAPGIKVHFRTEKDEDGIAQPVLDEGYPVADSIMLSALIFNTVYIKSGSKKPVNSRAPTRISKLIEKALNPRSIGLRTLSLKPDNFAAVVVDHTTILPEDIIPLAA